jgi:hypothetical protein
MSSLFEVLAGVPAGGGVATANICADETLAQLHPALSGIDTSLAHIAAGLHLSIYLFQVFTFRHDGSSQHSLG